MMVITTLHKGFIFIFRGNFGNNRYIYLPLSHKGKYNQVHIYIYVTANLYNMSAHKLPREDCKLSSFYNLPLHFSRFKLG